MPEPIQANPSPKARFMGTKAYVEAHRSLMQRDDVQRGLDYAIMSYQGELSSQRVDGQGAAANFFKITGALELIQTLKNLGESPRLPATTTSNSALDHQA